MTFTELLEQAQESRVGRNPGQWTPRACQIWRDADPADARLLEAAFAWELSAGRIARPADEPVIRQCLVAMDAATAAVRGQTLSPATA